MKYSIYTTYLFENNAYSTSNPFGITTPIHCNYINKLNVDNIANAQLSLYFTSEDDFPFMYNGGYNYNKWTANRIKILVQMVDNTVATQPKNDEWRVFDVTNQLEELNNTPITPTILVKKIFNIKLNEYYNQPFYDLSYLSYPTTDDKLSFGDELFFMGNVETKIIAEAHRMKILVDLPNNEYNFTTNPTWNGNEDVFITEVGLYSDDGVLLGIGKLNKPVNKNNTINRNITFEIDF